jgi:hypothetical protein
MSRHDKSILGISVRSNHIGIAVIKDSSLMYWKVRKFNGAWSQKRLEKMIALVQHTAQRYSVTAIAVKVPPRGLLSKGLVELVSEISRLASTNDITLQPYRIQELKRFLSKKSLNKKVLLHLVCERFPILERYYQRELANRQPYHIKMFEAVAAALCLQATRK